MERTYTVLEVAERYSVTKWTVWEWIKRGKLPAIKTGRYYRIRRQDVEAFDEKFKTN